MKTESEIYKACIDAGLKAGDIVRMSNGCIDFLLDLSLDSQTLRFAWLISIRKYGSAEISYWPTHYARPRYKTDAFGSYLTLSDSNVHGTIEIPYPPPPDQKSIEERVANLERRFAQLGMPDGFERAI